MDEHMLEPCSARNSQNSEVSASTIDSVDVRNLNSNCQENDDIIRELLFLARQLIFQEKPSNALQAVVMAMQRRGGDDAAFEALHRARQLYLSRLQMRTATDELASLFAECAINEAYSATGLLPQPQQHPSFLPPPTTTPEEASILSETGRSQIVLDAFSDGSSFICLSCGGLVGNQRRQEHHAFWCCER